MGCAPEPLGVAVINPEGDTRPLAPLEDLLGDAPPNSSLQVHDKGDVVRPPRFDLVAKQSPVKDQGQRGTCTIFATTALMEGLYIKAGKGTHNFSEQWLNWAVKVIWGYNPDREGSSVQYNMSILSTVGGIAEADWPYESWSWLSSSQHDECTTTIGSPIECYTNGHPSADVIYYAKRFTVPVGKYINTADLKAHLYDQRTGAVATLPYYSHAWRQSTDYATKGYVLTPSDAAVAAGSDGGHAILIVGWDDNLELTQLDSAGNPVIGADGQPVTDKGFYIFKNSWSDGWAWQSPVKAGYGLISQRYVERFASVYVSTPPTP